MCGVFGLVASKGIASVDALATVFGTLAVQNTARGADSFGVWQGTQVLARAEGTPVDVFRLAREALTSHPARPLCGHTRMATRGRPTTENAHPFTFAVPRGARNIRYVAAHNGCVVPGEKAPNVAYECYMRHAVDSAAFFAALFEHSVPADAWEGYGTFVWNTSADAAVHIGCADSFELACVTAEVARGTVTIWSSDEDHLRAAIRACLRTPRLRWHDMAAGQWRVTAAGPVPMADNYRFSNLMRTLPATSWWAHRAELPLSCDVPRSKRRHVLVGSGDQRKDVRPIRSNVPFVVPRRGK